MAYARGLIVYSRRTRDGVAGDHILVCPPLIVDNDHLDEIIDGLDATLIDFTHEIHTQMKAGQNVSNFGYLRDYRVNPYSLNVAIPADYPR